ncbi:MAG TPA: site-specific integrase [Puia sp.]|jgi:hypothetical protein
MFLPIKPICDRRPRRDGTCVISIQYCFSSDKRTLLFTRLSIPPRYWNKKLMRISSDLPAEFGNAEQLNRQLQKMLRTAEDIVNFSLQQQIEDPIDFLKQLFRPDFDLATLPEKVKKMTIPGSSRLMLDNLDLFVQLDDYIRTKSRKVSPAMLKVYKILKNRLTAFQKFRKKKITFDCFDFNFYEAFINFLTFDYVQMRKKTVIRGLKLNSMESCIKQLRIFLRDRMRRKIIAPIDLSDFKILDEETDAIYLSVQEIRAMYNLDLSGHPHLKRFRDLFVLGSFTGLRFSDFSNIKPEDIRKGMLYKKQGKSDHWVVIPLRPEASEILINRFRNMVPKVSNPEMNRHIKQVGRWQVFLLSSRLPTKKEIRT